MKVFISADMEGTAGIACWPETERDKPEYPEFQALMTAEVVAACEGALEAGATCWWTACRPRRGSFATGRAIPIR
jgi:D-amino peptidase